MYLNMLTVCLAQDAYMFISKSLCKFEKLKGESCEVCTYVLILGSASYKSLPVVMICVGMQDSLTL
jgi:hypothetical protein